jgi:hypothetical protein
MKYPKGIRAAKRPTMRNHRGRTWDVCDVILPGGKKITGHLDTTWSLYFYFEVEGIWRRGEIAHFERGTQGMALVMDLTKEPQL